MKTQNRYLYSVLIVGLMAVLVVSGCAQTQVKTVSEYGAKLPRPDRIFVYDFATSPDDVDTSKGIISDLEHLVKKTPRTKEEKAVGRHVANALSKELVKEIQNFGLPAERAAGKPPATGKILEIEGQFLSIDEGNQTERVIIGFGLGRTDVKTNVQVYDTAAQGRRAVEKFTTDAKSGRKPGMAVFVGAGALAGHAAVSALVSGGVSAASEKFSANVEADAKRTAKEIAKRLGQFFVRQGWIPASAVK
jgi:hypothetical protein